jgi:hypothetical protein
MLLFGSQLEGRPRAALVSDALVRVGRPWPTVRPVSRPDCGAHTRTCAHGGSDSWDLEMRIPQLRAGRSSGRSRSPSGRPAEVRTGCTDLPVQGFRPEGRRRGCRARRRTGPGACRHRNVSAWMSASPGITAGTHELALSVGSGSPAGSRPVAGDGTGDVRLSSGRRGMNAQASRVTCRVPALQARGGSVLAARRWPAHAGPLTLARSRWPAHAGACRGRLGGGRSAVGQCLGSVPTWKTVP